MEKLNEIKADIRRGRMRLANIDWLVNEVETLSAANKELRNKTRYQNFMKMAKENLALEEGLRRVQEQRDHYKQAYEALKKAL